MAAPQIPNLNLLRRGRGRGRGSSSSSSSSDAPENSQAGRVTGKDRIVQSTDGDASVSRLSAVQLGYLNDPFARVLTPPNSAQRRLPIINRGTYVRTVAIDQLVDRFLNDPSSTGSHCKKQIISLGAGSDTRVFRLFARRDYSSRLIYHEIDFAVNTSAKIRTIRSTPQLQRGLGIEETKDNVSISDAGDALHSPSYHIHPCDLRSLKADPSITESLLGIDRGLPTLLISECCLIYLLPSEAVQVLTFFTEHLFGSPQGSSEKGELQRGCANTVPLGLILYEPIRPNDAFGRTMVSNLATRGIQLQTLHKYSSLGAQRVRLLEQGFRAGQAAADIDFIWEWWVSEEEKERVAGLEMLDEMEEWKLLAQHYCVSWGWRDEDDSAVFDGWKTVPAQSGD
ncbi:Uncharacterized protein PECH_007942 [Penicillium ucsense]|uniref:Leucine carboxyl methyltransferase 1 n=1 Tax=Penicillium ucsense TaxID=2839758 RepID=A0A8J8WK84_9EURO|nr:Uncharacterized protein PECM_004161 [Penicillium ucsense]KAF7734491.1 Uncharacterized protein PECH_007942 [Penicillium ucsense]